MATGHSAVKRGGVTYKFRGGERVDRPWGRQKNQLLTWTLHLDRMSYETVTKRTGRLQDPPDAVAAVRSAQGDRGRASAKRALPKRVRAIEPKVYRKRRGAGAIPPERVVIEPLVVRDFWRRAIRLEESIRQDNRPRFVDELMAVARTYAMQRQYQDTEPTYAEAGSSLLRLAEVADPLGSAGKLRWPVSAIARSTIRQAEQDGCSLAEIRDRLRSAAASQRERSKRARKRTNDAAIVAAEAVKRLLRRWRIAVSPSSRVGAGNRCMQLIYAHVHGGRFDSAPDLREYLRVGEPG
jgi:hypothetical protein